MISLHITFHELLMDFIKVSCKLVLQLLEVFTFSFFRYSTMCINEFGVLAGSYKKVCLIWYGFLCMFCENGSECFWKAFEGHESKQIWEWSSVRFRIVCLILSVSRRNNHVWFYIFYILFFIIVSWKQLWKLLEGFKF